MKKVYADNSSTSFPKAPGVSDVIKDYLDHNAYNVNRGGYSGSYDIAMEILEARQLIADMFHISNPQEVVFTPGITYSLNMLLAGLLKKGDHVVTTSMEHNAVMRTLYACAKAGVTYDIVRCNNDGNLNISDIIPYIKKETRAIVMLHASNVCGTVMPIESVAEICRCHNIRLIVDTAQTAGVLDIYGEAVDALAFTGHKGLLGPQGIGGFIIKKSFADEIAPIIVGGTGSLSHVFIQPPTLPDKFESGTMNIPAILGLKKALQFISHIGIDVIYKNEFSLASRFITAVEKIGGINIIGGSRAGVAVVSLDFTKHDNAIIAAALDEDFGIMARCGLHCAPLAHKTLGTYPHGTVRFSFGYFNTADEVDYIVESIKEIINKAHG